MIRAGQCGQSLQQAAGKGERKRKEKKAVKVSTTWSGGMPEEVVFEQLGWFLCSCV